jgi:hypothetical protein
MGKRTRCLTTAAFVTMLDAAVATHYGSLVWKVFSGIIWSKLLLLLLAAVWATTLLHVWVHACFRLRQTIQGHQVVVPTPSNSLSAEFSEEIDV